MRSRPDPVTAPEPQRFPQFLEKFGKMMSED
jgi:hypothetical protein